MGSLSGQSGGRFSFPSLGILPAALSWPSISVDTSSIELADGLVQSLLFCGCLHVRRNTFASLPRLLWLCWCKGIDECTDEARAHILTPLHSGHSKFVIFSHWDFVRLMHFGWYLHSVAAPDQHSESTSSIIRQLCNAQNDDHLRKEVS